MPRESPKKLQAQMLESREGCFEFDTSAAGPFLLPALDEFESATPLENTGLVELRFRDLEEGKAYRVRLAPQTLPGLWIALKAIYEQHGERLSRQFSKFSKTSGSLQ